MINRPDNLTDNLARVPGLYRRWELPEILKSQRAYRIENAGQHQDGTPLVAVYVDATTHQSGGTASTAQTDTDIDLPGTNSKARE